MNRRRVIKQFTLFRNLYLGQASFLLFQAAQTLRMALYLSGSYGKMRLLF